MIQTVKYRAGGHPKRSLNMFLKLLVHYHVSRSKATTEIRKILEIKLKSLMINLCINNMYLSGHYISSILG